MPTDPTNTPAAQAPEPRVSLYEALGQITGLPPAQAVTVAVEQLYGRVFADPALAGTFRPPLASLDFTAPEHRPRLEAHMRAFLVAALGGSDRYQGRGMAQAHARLRITDEQFSRVIEHAVTTLDGLGVPPEAVGAVGAKLAPLRPHIVTA
jgi:hemoglobin